MSETGSAFSAEVPPVVFDDSGVQVINELLDAAVNDRPGVS